MRDWLSLKSVVALDSAFCCRSHRGDFADLLRSDEYCIHEQVITTHQSELLHVVEKFGEKLRSVVVSGSLSPTQAKLVSERCRNLTHVRFYGSSYGCTRDLWNILNDKIAKLDLSKMCIDSVSLLQIAKLCPYILSLSLADMRLQDQQLSLIVNECLHIAHLDISSNFILTDAGILNTVVNLRSLRGLNIEKNYKLTDISLVHIYTHCARMLHTLHIDCPVVHRASSVVLVSAFSVSAICALLKHCTQLRTLHIGKHVSPHILTVTLPLNAVCNITTLVMGGRVFDTNTTHGNYCTKLRTIATDVLCNRGALVNLVRHCPNLRSVCLKRDHLDALLLSTANKCEKELIAVLFEELQAGVVLKRVPSWDEYSEHDVMNM